MKILNTKLNVVVCQCLEMINDPNTYDVILHNILLSINDFVFFRLNSTFRLKF